MGEVKRYDPNYAAMSPADDLAVEAEDGMFVMATDYATLEAENAKLRAELERLAADGWKRVPVEPTQDIRGAIDLLCDDHRAFDDADAFWHYLLDSAPSAPKADPVKVLPYWEPCNPGCDPEFNGQRSSECAGLCHNARVAIAAARQEGGKV